MRTITKRFPNPISHNWKTPPGSPPTISWHAEKHYCTGVPEIPVQCWDVGPSPTTIMLGPALDTIPSILHSFFSGTFPRISGDAQRSVLVLVHTRRLVTQLLDTVMTITCGRGSIHGVLSVPAARARRSSRFRTLSAVCTGLSTSSRCPSFETRTAKIQMALPALHASADSISSTCSSSCSTAPLLTQPSVPMGIPRLSNVLQQPAPSTSWFARASSNILGLCVFIGRGIHVDPQGFIGTSSLAFRFLSFGWFCRSLFTRPFCGLFKHSFQYTFQKAWVPDLGQCTVL